MRMGPRCLLVRLIAVGVAVFTFSGCYLAKQGAHLIRYQLAAEPVDQLLQYYRSSAVGADRRAGIEFLTEVDAIREYASTELGLNLGESYSRVVRTERSHLVDVVNATSATSFTRHTWWWPIAGRFPYKGFYEPADARREADRLRRRGLDVWVRPVDAFSTLGVFADPLYDFMADYSSYRLANLIIHESVHATVYFKNQGQFNEELATFIGDRGALAYLADRYGPQSREYSRALSLVEDPDTYRSAILDLKAELAAMYGRELPVEQTLTRKIEIISAFQSEFAQSYEHRFGTDVYRSFADLPVNNAYLDLFVQYSGETELYEQLLDALCGDPAELVRFASQLPGDDPKGAIRAYLLDTANSAPID